MGTPFEKLSPKVQAQVLAAGLKQAPARKVEPNPDVKFGFILSAPKRLRQSTKPVMNGLETRFYEERLTPDYVANGETVLIQAVRLELARGIWYKVDFFLPGVKHSRGALAYEVKGPHAFRGGFENLKVAARVHPWVTFYLVWEFEGAWKRQEVLP